MPVDSLLQDSITNQVSYQERSIDLVGSLQAEAPLVQKAHGDTNGPVEEAVDLLPGWQDPAPGTRKGLCRTGFQPSVCCVLTCGLYPTCQRVIRFPCLVAETVTAAEPEKADLQADGVVRRQPESVGLPLSDSFRYPDVCIDGKKVVVPSSEKRVPKRVGSKVPIGAGWSSDVRALSSNSVYSLDELSDECERDSSTDIDALIARKLLVLYTRHQIDQLAACASDSAFLSQTAAICQLIANLQQERHLPEQEAERFVVQGILRLSTRGRKKSHTRTEPDSGRDTMLETLHSIDNDHEVKISEQTPADRMARQMRPDDRQARSSSPIPNSPCHTDTDSSGVPLLHAFVRT